jgi:hypothetical protein
MRTRDKASPESTSSGKSHKASSFNNAKLQLIFCKCTLYVAGKAWCVSKVLRIWSGLLLLLLLLFEIYRMVVPGHLE